MPFWGPRWGQNRKNDVRQAEPKNLDKRTCVKGGPGHPATSWVTAWLALKEFLPGRHSEAFPGRIPSRVGFLPGWGGRLPA